MKMAIEFNVKPSFGYYDKSEVKTVKKGNTITIIPVSYTHLRAHET